MLCGAGAKAGAEAAAGRVWEMRAKDRGTSTSWDRDRQRRDGRSSPWVFSIVDKNLFLESGTEARVKGPRLGVG